MNRPALMIAIPLLVCGAWAHAQGASAPPPKDTAASAATPAVEYRPPARGAPRVRVGGSTRSMVRTLSLVVIAPDHVGLAATDQPELYWYISDAVKTPLEFSLVPVDASEPLAEAPIPPVARGIHRVRVADLGVKLKAGEEYQWTVTLLRDATSGKKEAVASGRVRVQPPAARVGSGYAELARSGYWYDAIADLRRRRAEQPGNEALAAAQRSLLEQVGLAEIVRD